MELSKVGVLAAYAVVLRLLGFSAVPSTWSWFAQVSSRDQRSRYRQPRSSVHVLGVWVQDLEIFRLHERQPKAAEVCCPSSRGFVSFSGFASLYRMHLVQSLYFVCLV